MLVLLFSVGPDRYALDAHDIIEVLPLVALKGVPAAPPYLAGLLNYHGTAIPVVDLNLLMTGQPCRQSLSSRILLTHCRLGDGRVKPLGLMADAVNETARIDPADLRPSAIAGPGYLGEVLVRDADMVQIVCPEALLTDAARALLYPDGEEDKTLADSPTA